MTQMSSPESHDTQDQVFGKYGCAVFILAAVLFAVQRFILFGWLLLQSSLGRAFAPNATEFLFGNPPYSLTDILLGLEFPDEGLLYLLQPHNLAIAVTQAAHFGITIGLVYVPFFLFIKARTSPRHRVWLRVGGCLFALAIPVSIAVCAAACVVGPFPGDGAASPTPPAATTPAPIASHTATNTPIPSPAPSPVTAEPGTYAQYSNTELRFSAEYPVGWVVDLTDNRNPITGEALDGKIVGFLPPEGDRVKQRAISVLVLTTPPGVQLGPEDMPTDQWYVDYIRDWAEMMPVEIVGDPSIVEVDGYKAAEVVTSGTEEYAGVVGYATFLVTEDRMFYVEVSGDPGMQPEILRICEHFMATFDVLPLP